MFSQYGQFFAAPAFLTFDGGSSLTMDVTRNGSSSGYGGGTGGFTAAQQIAFQGELKIPVGMEVRMTTDQLADRTCPTPDLRAKPVGTCPTGIYNTLALPTRQAGPTQPLPVAAQQEDDALTLAPNPARQATTVYLSGATEGGGIRRVELLTLRSQLLWQSSPATGVRSVEVPLRNTAAGLYLIRVTTQRGSYVRKLLVE